MHILMIAPGEIPVPGNGSVEICMLAIAKQLARAHRVTIVSRLSPRYPSISRYPNMTIVRVPGHDPRSYISSVIRMIKANERQYDLIQVDNRPHHMAKVKAAFPGIPVTLFLHSTTFVPQTAAVSQSMKAANMIVANSSSLAACLKMTFPAVRHKISQVYLGVDTSRFKPLSETRRRKLRNAYGIGRAYAILFVGRVVSTKGLPILIRAVKHVRRAIPNTKLVVVGGGKPGYMRKLRSIAFRERVPTRFVGRVPHRQIHRMFGIADCFACPSQRHEAFGLVNVEALASGIPVVASNNGGIKEIIQPGRNGFLVGDYDNPRQFAKHLIRIGKSRSLARRLSLQGRIDVKNRFSWRQTAVTLSRLYNGLTAKYDPQP